jgi:hypothetical protein
MTSSSISDMPETTARRQAKSVLMDYMQVRSDIRKTREHDALEASTTKVSLLESSLKGAMVNEEDDRPPGAVRTRDDYAVSSVMRPVRTSMTRSRDVTVMRCADCSVVLVTAGRVDGW